MILDPADVPPAVVALTDIGCRYTKDPDARDPFSAAEFGMVTGETALSLNELGDWLRDSIGQFGGDLVEWDCGEPWKI